ncbi:MAG: type I restriction-modification system subunit M, partial [Bacteroides sp.]
MSTETHNQIVSFIWSIADVCLRDVYVRGKYRDIILPMVVLRRLDALLEQTHQEVLKEYHYQIHEMEQVEPAPDDLCMVSGYNFYNISKWTLKELARTAGNSKQLLVENFREYLDGFSDNVKEIINCFKLKDQIQHLADKDRLLLTIQMFTSPDINLSTQEREDSDGRRLAPLSNLGMGYVFEELIRKFNEENNEEAGEHFTPREVIQLMTNLTILPIRDDLPPVIQVYDPACGTGGMLTESQNFIKEIQPTSIVELYGKEINDE